MKKENGDRETRILSVDGKKLMYDRGTIKVVVFACIVIVLAVVLTGSTSYFITRDAVVDKLKTRDLVHVIGAIAAKIDGRLERAKETSLLLAKDPAIVEWVSGAETDGQLGEYTKAKITDIARNYDYANSFIVSAVTSHYWAEDAKMIQVMSPADPSAKWFYDTLRSGKAIDLNIDYNSGRQDTFVFLNALVGDVRQPVAVTGVGLSLKEIASEFRSYKIGDKSNLWLVDDNGKIHLSDDLGHNGLYLNDFVPPGISAQVIGDKDKTSTKPKIIEYRSATGETVDLAYQSMTSTNWKVVFQIPRSESIAILAGIKLNAGIAGLVSLVLMVFIFYVVSRRVADPLKRAIMLTQVMEKEVSERTRELADKNEKIMDSIAYAKRLQESMLATPGELQNVLGEHFILWQPRDIVGGDFYWVRRIDDRKSMFAVIDCTGHGVPGAFMTMAVNSILNQIVGQQRQDPAAVLSELNRRLKKTLHRNDGDWLGDDGLDIGIGCIDNKENLLFAGAKLPLYIRRGDQVHVIKGDRRSIGYRRSSDDLEFTNNTWTIESGDTFYLTTDGYIDQNGGVRDYPLGRTRFLRAVAAQGGTPLPQQQQAFRRLLDEYKGDEPQRDDITMIGFSFR